MKTVEIASERGLNKFLSAQMEVYLGQVRDQYGLPDPNAIKEPYIRLAVTPAATYRDKKFAIATKVEWIEFHKKDFILFDKTISIWVKQ